MSVSINGIKDGFVSGLHSSGSGIKNCVKWGGRKIQNGFSHYLVPAVKKTWQVISKSFDKTVAFFRTGYGLGTLAGIAGLTFFAISETEALSGDENRPYRYALLALTAISLVGAGFLLNYRTAALI